MMSHKCIADGKQLLLWISVLEWGAGGGGVLGLMTTGRDLI